MKGYSTKDVLQPDFRMPTDYNELVKVYRTLAKSADQRLVRLEKYANEPNMGNALTWAYARAQHDIEQWSGSEANRFNTAPPPKKQSLLAKINDIKNFLESPSSTKKGISNIYKRRADSLNQQYNTNFTWEDIGSFFESDLYSKLDASYGSATILEAMGIIQHNKAKVRKIINSLQEESEKDIKDKNVIRVQNDAILMDVVNNIISDYPDEIKEMLGV